MKLSRFLRDDLTSPAPEIWDGGQHEHHASRRRCGKSRASPLKQVAVKVDGGAAFLALQTLPTLCTDHRQCARCHTRQAFLRLTVITPPDSLPALHIPSAIACYRADPNRRAAMTGCYRLRSRDKVQKLSRSTGRDWPSESRGEPRNCV